MIYPERVGKDFKLVSQLPAPYFEAAQSDNKTWHSIWSDRAGELALLGVGLAVLTWALRQQRWLSADLRRLRRFRLAYLLFTLFFIGWYAQGQLSIVNLTALLQALVAGRSLVFFLYDPMTVVLWLFVMVTFFVWGRGTFCGWLCPFGALQELVSQLAKRLRVPQLRLSTRSDARLKLVKYAVLAVVLVTALLSVSWTDRLVEVEPFKTSITLLFVRDWPYVLWAVGLLLLSTVVYKGFCRYLCPLGAGMALLGRLRLVDWLPRRAECGQPCQRCQSECEYQAIKKTGEIVYEECFQCLDCVAIEQSDALCVPLMLEKRRMNTIIPIHPVASSFDAMPPTGARP
jgi:polyferredoxin